MTMTHTLHSRDVPTEYCTECKINEAHADRFRGAIVASRCDRFTLPMKTIVILQEENRQDWIRAGKSSEDPDKPSRQHNKTNLLWDYVRTHDGQRAVLSELVEELDTTEGTVYSFIRSNSAYFTKLGISTWVIVDRDAERAAMKSTGSAQRLPVALGSDGLPVTMPPAPPTTFERPKPTPIPAKD